MSFRIEHLGIYILIFPVYLWFVYFLHIKKGFSFDRIFILSVFFWYIAVVIDVTFFSIFEYAGHATASINSMDHISLVPFASISPYFDIPTEMPQDLRLEIHEEMIYQLWSKFLLFVPFGFLLPLLNSRLSTWKCALIGAFVVPFLKEILQLISVLISYSVFSWRMNAAFDVDDIILNSLGWIFGYLLYNIFCMIFLNRQNPKNRQKIGQSKKSS